MATRLQLAGFALDLENPRKSTSASERVGGAANQWRDVQKFPFLKAEYLPPPCKLRDFCLVFGGLLSLGSPSFTHSYQSLPPHLCTGCAPFKQPSFRPTHSAFNPTPRSRHTQEPAPPTAFLVFLMVVSSKGFPVYHPRAMETPQGGMNNTKVMKFY